MAINGESERKSRWRMAHRALITLIEHRGEMAAYRDHRGAQYMKINGVIESVAGGGGAGVKAKSINISGEMAAINRWRNRNKHQ
jgi:hypothetical protein